MLKARIRVERAGEEAGGGRTRPNKSINPTASEPASHGEVEWFQRCVRGGFSPALDGSDDFEVETPRGQSEQKTKELIAQGLRKHLGNT